MDIGKLVSDDSNPRKHNPKNIGVIVESLNRCGFGRSILIDENDVVLCGNGVIEAAGIAGIEGLEVVDISGDKVIALRRSNLSKEQKDILRVADNRANELSSWDMDVLGTLDIDTSWLFDNTIIKREEGREVEEVEVNKGDVFLVNGKHIISCGDYEFGDYDVSIGDRTGNLGVVKVENFWDSDKPDTVLIVDGGTGYYDIYFAYGELRGRTMFPNYEELLFHVMRGIVFCPNLSSEELLIGDRHIVYGIQRDPKVLGRLLKGYAWEKK